MLSIVIDGYRWLLSVINDREWLLSVIGWLLMVINGCG